MRLTLAEAAASPRQLAPTAFVRSVDEARARLPLAAVITKDLCTYSIWILRQEKILRDHGPTAGRRVGRVADESSLAGVTSRKKSSDLAPHHGSQIASDGSAPSKIRTCAPGSGGRCSIP
jgi:hypothetical protein